MHNIFTMTDGLCRAACCARQRLILPEEAVLQGFLGARTSISDTVVNHHHSSGTRLVLPHMLRWHQLGLVFRRHAATPGVTSLPRFFPQWQTSYIGVRAAL